jgi:hypothetical protein
MLQSLQSPIFGSDSSPAHLGARHRPIRRVYFSFQYQRDLARVNRIRKIPNVVAYSAAGFTDAALWQKTRRRGDAAVRQMIESAIENTTVTVICIGHQLTANDKFVAHEIERTFAHGNGIVALHLPDLRDEDGNAVEKGRAPTRIAMSGYRAYDYTDRDQLAAHIEEAARLAQS